MSTVRAVVRAIVAMAGAATVLLTSLGAPVSAQSVCPPTTPDMEGPFYKPGAPTRARTGQGLVLSGTVRSAAGCAALAGARLEWWSADGRGRYDDEHRATELADPAGRYRYETEPPGRYPGRPPHVHVRVTARGHRPLVTQLYPAAGQTTLQVDFILVPE